MGLAANLYLANCLPNINQLVQLKEIYNYNQCASVNAKRGTRIFDHYVTEWPPDHNVAGKRFAWSQMNPADIMYTSHNPPILQLHLPIPTAVFMKFRKYKYGD